MKNIITWFSTYQEKMKKRTLRIHRNIEAARLRRARRKRGLAYTYCKNCGTKLKGMYCHRCGQYALDIYQPFWKYIQQYFENVYQFDTKVWQTLWLMFTRPGFLTREFNAGKINSYVHPFRLYMFVSVLFFTFFFMVAEEETDKALTTFRSSKITSGLVEKLNEGSFSQDTAVYVYNGRGLIAALENRGVEHADSLISVTRLFTSLELDWVAMPRILLDTCCTKQYPTDSELDEIRQIQDLLAADSLQAGEEYGVDLIPGMTIYNENQLTAEKIEACMKFQADSLKGELTPVYRWSQRAEESDALRENSLAAYMIGQLSKWTPLYMMFLLPLFAWLLKKAYRKKHMPYMWHFAHTVHLNTLFLILLPLPLAYALTAFDWQTLSLAPGVDIAFGLFAIAVFAYMLWSLHTVYRDGWIRTFLKTLLVIVIFTVLSFLFAGIAIVSLLMEVSKQV